MRVVSSEMLTPTITDQLFIFSLLYYCTIAGMPLRLVETDSNPCAEACRAKVGGGKLEDKEYGVNYWRV